MIRRTITILIIVFLLAATSYCQTDTCDDSNIGEICCNDYGCCWSSGNDTASVNVGCFNFTIAISTSTIYTTTTVDTTTTQMMTTLEPTTTDLATTDRTTYVDTTTVLTTYVDTTTVLTTAAATTTPQMTTVVSTLYTTTQEPTTVAGCFVNHTKSYLANGLLQPQFTTEYDCKDGCAVQPNCIAVALFAKVGATGCVFYTQAYNLNEIYPHNGFDFWIYDARNCKRNGTTIAPMTTTEHYCPPLKMVSSNGICSTGLLFVEDVFTLDECIKFCRCYATNCVSIVFRNVTDAPNQCFYITRHSDLNNVQTCEDGVQQFLAVRESTTGLSTDMPDITDVPDEIWSKPKCWKPILKPHSTLTLYKDEYGFSAIYTCNIGYMYPSGEKARSFICIDQKWFPEYEKDCIAITCPIPLLEPTIQDPDYSDLLGIFYVIPPETQWTRQCLSTESEAERFLGGLRIEATKCVSSNGVARLEPRPSNCELGCYSPPLIANTSVEFFPKYRYAKYVCIMGHRAPDGGARRIIQCNGDGTWPDIEPCSAIFCENLPINDQTILSSKNIVFGTIVQVSCKDGYMQPDNRISVKLKCIENSNEVMVEAGWNDTVSECIEVKCFNPPMPDPFSCLVNYGSLNDKDSIFNYKATVVYTCIPQNNMKFEDGYKIRNVLCVNNGLWNYTTVDCAENRCDPVIDIANAQYSNMSANAGNTVIITCNIGFQFSKGVLNQRTTCDGANWSPISFTICKPLYCISPTIKNAVYNATVGALIPYNEMLVVKCLSGYYLESLLSSDDPEYSGIMYSENIYCQPDESWSREVVCLPKDCGTLKGLENFIVDTATLMSTLFPAKNQYFCIPNYWYGRDDYQFWAKCNTDGNWEVDGTTNKKKWRTCDKITCPSIVFASVDSTSTDVGSAINVSCSNGRKFVGTNTIRFISTCKREGYWFPQIPDCELLDPVPTNKTVTESEGGNIIAFVAISVVIVEVIILLIIDIPGIVLSVKKACSSKPPKPNIKKKN